MDEWPRALTSRLECRDQSCGPGERNHRVELIIVHIAYAVTPVKVRSQKLEDLEAFDKLTASKYVNTWNSLQTISLEV